MRTALAAWGLERLLDDGILIVTELVANAVQHTEGRRIRVSISSPSENYVRIGVVDKSRTMPVRRVADDNDVRGRGLALVDALTSRWGTDRVPWGKASGAS
ncbi:ATP-binding protein [Actinacidiphila oryziradicis]|uniref:ATP-binding protein n=1 Tax=Actinacidiphila oryziradicis TaxID=2571141 RepID=UPI001FEB6AAE|nr:ATP-binding protein [Actinacidiphila oryziradicis]